MLGPQHHWCNACGHEQVKLPRPSSWMSKAHFPIRSRPNSSTTWERVESHVDILISSKTCLLTGRLTSNLMITCCPPSASTMAWPRAAPVMEQPLSLLFYLFDLINYASLILLNKLFFSIPSLFGLVDNIIKFKGGHMSNICLSHQSDTSPYGYLFTPYLLLWLNNIHLYFYWLIRLLIYLSSYLLICLYLWLIW